MASLSNFSFTFPSIQTSKDHPLKHNLRHNISKLPFTTKVNNQLKITQNRVVNGRVSQLAENDREIEVELNQGDMFDGTKYRQTYIIRSTEVGPDKTATFESILNLVQETGLNHVIKTGKFAGEYGATHEMVRNNLIWVVSRMQVEVGHYPKWGEKIDIETWSAPSTKFSIQRETLIRSSATGLILAQAASTWVVMNRETRRLTKMSEALHTELSPLMIDKARITLVKEKIVKLDIDRAQYCISNLKPTSGDLDANNHVNNVKYIRWVFEAMPDHVLHSHQLSSLVLEYRKECGASDIIDSLCAPLFDDEEVLMHDEGQSKYTHLLQIKGGDKKGEILRGISTWKKNN